MENANTKGCATSARYDEMIITYIYEQEVGSSSILRLACLHLQAERSGTIGSICLGRIPDVRSGKSKDTGLVEEVIDQVELLCRIALCAIHVAVKGGVSDIKGCFPHIGEF